MKVYRLTDVIWRKDQDAVMKEIANLMGIESADTNTEGWFQHRTTAAKIVLNNMTEAERNALRQEAEDMAEKGMPEELQRK